MLPALHAGSASAAATPTSARLMPSGSANDSTVSPKRFSGASCVTPFSTIRSILYTIALSVSLCGCMVEMEEWESGDGMAWQVCIIEKNCAVIVEVHLLLDEAQPDDARIKIQIARRLAGNRRDVMDARHGSILHAKGRTKATRRYCYRSAAAEQARENNS